MVDIDDRLKQWEAWLAATDALAAEVLARRGGKFIPVDHLLAEERKGLEERATKIALPANRHIIPKQTSNTKT